MNELCDRCLGREFCPEWDYYNDKPYFCDGHKFKDKYGKIKFKVHKEKKAEEKLKKLNAKECRFCKYCDVNRTNDIGQVRCKRFSTYVNLFDRCDYFITERNERIEKILKELNE